jgi:hypothetical protein
VFYKALCRQRSSGLCWHQRFPAFLRSLCFNPCKGKNDIWIRPIIGVHEYNAIDWFYKLQAFVQTATFGSEFVAVRIAVNQIVDLHCTFLLLGVPVKEMTYILGDIRAVVNDSAIPSLSKRNNTLSFHRVREPIAKRIVNFVGINGKNNPADIVTKHWSYPQIWHVLQAILFYSGDTMDLIKENEIS